MQDPESIGIQPREHIVPALPTVHVHALFMPLWMELIQTLSSPDGCLIDTCVSSWSSRKMSHTSLSGTSSSRETAAVGSGCAVRDGAAVVSFDDEGSLWLGGTFMDCTSKTFLKPVLDHLSA